MININRKSIRIIVFYCIALVFSYYFRFLSPAWYNELHLPWGMTMIKEWFAALGIFLGALIITRIFKPERKNSLLGTSRLKSIVMALIPIGLFTIIGAENSENLNPHLFGFYLGLHITIYCILEETGWRGYLQFELRNENSFLQYLTIGFLWYAWHLTFLPGSFNIINELIIFLILFFASIGIGYAVKHTKSIMVAACMHMIGNIIAFSSLIKMSIDVQKRFIIIGISIIAWIFILNFWNKRILKIKKFLIVN